MSNVLQGTLAELSYLGNMVEYLVRADGREWRVQAHPHDLATVGADVWLELPPACCLCLPDQPIGVAAPHLQTPAAQKVRVCPSRLGGH
jgi:TOBE domain